MSADSRRSVLLVPALLLALLILDPSPALAQATSPFLTGATALQTNIIAWLTPIAIILVMVLGAMAMANRMLKSLAARIVFAPKDVSDAREISDELGFTTVRVKTVSKTIGYSFDSRTRRSHMENVGEDRRALLLPQEVKELGTEEAIVFYEGLRPIRCRKIRYFAEKSFRRRLLPPPATPTPPHRARLPQSPAACAASSVQATSAPPKNEPQSSETPAAVPPVEDPIVTREARPEDVERIDSLTLEDFATDFSKLQMPQREGPLSDVEMSAAVESFVSALRAR